MTFYMFRFGMLPGEDEYAGLLQYDFFSAQIKNARSRNGRSVE